MFVLISGALFQGSRRAHVQGRYIAGDGATVKRQAPRPFSIEYARIAKPSRKKERRGSNAPENGSNAPPKPNEDGQPSQRISIGWSLRQAIRPVCNHLPRGASGRKLASWVRALLYPYRQAKEASPWPRQAR